jgi:hypothetical protein
MRQSSFVSVFISSSKGAADNTGAAQLHAVFRAAFSCGAQVTYRQIFVNIGLYADALRKQRRPGVFGALGEAEQAEIGGADHDTITGARDRNRTRISAFEALHPIR